MPAASVESGPGRSRSSRGTPFSSTTVSAPCRAAARPADDPAGPPPTTATSIRSIRTRQRPGIKVYPLAPTREPPTVFVDGRRSRFVTRSSPHTDEPDIAVLRAGVHGMPASEYANALRERLPDYDIELAATPDDEQRLIEIVPVVAGNTIDEDLLDHAKNLELFASSYAGYGHLPMDALDSHDVAVTTASGVHGPNIAEDVIGFILTLTRRHH